jgi:tryptophan-rich sensory protein
MFLKVILFLVLNFSALALGGLFTSKGVSSDWYSNLAKAPWTPPGWVFGAAWTSIMICFSFYMAKCWLISEQKRILILLFALQWILNVAWNPLFFYYHNPLISLIVISALTLLVMYFLFGFLPHVKWYSLFILPYFVWLLIATSLNAYILLKN